MSEIVVSKMNEVYMLVQCGSGEAMEINQ